MKSGKKITIKSRATGHRARGREFFEQEIIRLSQLIVQKVQEAKDIRERLEALLKEKEQRQRTLKQEVQQRTEELEEKVQELEQFKKIAINRELKMVELKEEMNRLKKI